MCLQTVSRSVLAEVIAPSGSVWRRSSAFIQTAWTPSSLNFLNTSDMSSSAGALFFLLDSPASAEMPYKSNLSGGILFSLFINPQNSFSERLVLTNSGNS